MAKVKSIEQTALDGLDMATRIAHDQLELLQIIASARNLNLDEVKLLKACQEIVGTHLSVLTKQKESELRSLTAMSNEELIKLADSPKK